MFSSSLQLKRFLPSWIGILQVNQVVFPSPLMKNISVCKIPPPPNFCGPWEPDSQFPTAVTGYHNPSGGARPPNRVPVTGSQKLSFLDLGWTVMTHLDKVGLSTESMQNSGSLGNGTKFLFFSGLKIQPPSCKKGGNGET